METTLIFLFLFFSLIIAYLAKAFNFRILLGLPFITLFFLGTNILFTGIEMQSSSASYQYNYTYFNNSGTNMVTGMNVTNIPTYNSIAGTNNIIFGISYTQIFGLTLIIFAILCGFAAVAG